MKGADDVEFARARRFGGRLLPQLPVRLRRGGATGLGGRAGLPLLVGPGPGRGSRCGCGRVAMARAVPSWRGRVDMDVLARALLLLALDLSGHDENETGNKTGGELGKARPSDGRPGGQNLVADGTEEGGAS